MAGWFYTLRRSRSGSVTIEYSILLAVIVLGGLGSYFSLSYSSVHIFDHLASLQNLEDTRNTASSSSPLSSSSLAKGESRADGTGSVSEAGVMQAASEEISQRGTILLCLGIMASILVAGEMVLRHRRRRVKGKSADGPLATEQLPPRTQHRLAEKYQQIRRLFLGKVESSPGFEPQVRHLMSKQLRTIEPKKPLSQVIHLMETHRIRHLLVCGKDGALQGIISDRDLKKKDQGTAADIMTKDPITVTSEMTVNTAITLMLNHSISCLPVVDHGEVIGLLTTTDLILSLQCSLRVLSQLTLDPPTSKRRDRLTAMNPVSYSNAEDESESLTEEDTPEEELVGCC